VEDKKVEFDEIIYFKGGTYRLIRTIEKAN